MAIASAVPKLAPYFAPSNLDVLQHPHGPLAHGVSAHPSRC